MRLIPRYGPGASVYALMTKASHTRTLVCCLGSKAGRHSLALTGRDGIASVPELG
jgi:hypothetical protein